METSGYHNAIAEDYTEVYQQLPLKLLLAYGMGHVMNDVCASMWFTYLLVFFHFVLEFDSWQAGLILLVGQVADAIATPFVGFHSDLTDNFWLCRYGKRKTWHLLGSICVLGAFPFIFSPCVDCENSPAGAQLFYFSVFVVIFQFGWASVQISHLSLIPELTPNENDRIKLTAIRYSFTVFSNVLVYVITWAVLHINGDSDESQIGPSDTKKFELVVWIGLGFGVVCTLIFHCFVHEDNNGGGSDVRGSQLQSGVTELLCSLNVYKVRVFFRMAFSTASEYVRIRDKQICTMFTFQVAAVYMSTRLFVNLSQVFIPLYLHETLNMAAQALAIVPLTMFLSSFVTSFLIEFINRKFGRKVSYMIGAVLGIFACVWVQINNEPEFILYEIYIVAILFGAGGSIILVTSLGITADLIGTNTGNGAFIYGVMSFTDKLSNGIAVVIIQDLHNSKSNRTYYKDVLSYVCGGAAIFGALAVLILIKNARERSGYIAISDTDNNIITNEPRYAVINSVQEDIQPTLIS